MLSQRVIWLQVITRKLFSAKSRRKFCTNSTHSRLSFSSSAIEVHNQTIRVTQMTNRVIRKGRSVYRTQAKPISSSLRVWPLDFLKKVSFFLGKWGLWIIKGKKRDRTKVRKQINKGLKLKDKGDSLLDFSFLWSRREGNTVSVRLTHIGERIKGSIKIYLSMHVTC